jgi:hypothetical protein
MIRFVSTTVLCAAAVTFALACSSAPEDDGGASSGTGSVSGTGAASGTGGATGTGGVAATGGVASGGSATGGAASGGAAIGGSATGGAATGGSATGGAATGGTSACGAPSASTELGTGVMAGTGSSDERYYTADDITRDGTPYYFITNGWGPGFGSHTNSWNGTSFKVESMEGQSGTMGQPASYPSLFCGKYSIPQAPDCGLPKAIDEIQSLRTGWRWAPNGNTDGEYNAAYDIWVGNGSQRTGFLMVWLRDPPSYHPAQEKNPAHQGIAVANVPGVWDIWDGDVGGVPIINWVRAEGCDSHEIEFDVMDFIRDAEQRGYEIPGTHINAVAVGFEIWDGPITNLETLDFYVDAK